MSSGKYDFSLNRAAISVLIVMRERGTTSQLKETLKALGIYKIKAFYSHVEALSRMREDGRNYDLILFDAVSTDMPSEDFVKQAVDIEERAMLIAVSAAPKVDDVFSLLRSGSRSFLVTPFTPDSMERVLIAAHDGPPLSEAILNSPDRNSSLVGLILNCLYRLSVLMRQSREYPISQRLIDEQRQYMIEAVELARLFSEGTEDDLREQIIKSCINRANVASTRLGRTRKRLERQRRHSVGTSA